MYRSIVPVILGAAAGVASGGGDPVAAEVIALEQGALEKWAKGDPSRFLELSSPDVTYFDPFQEKRLDGLQALTALYDGLRGTVHIDRFEMVAPEVQHWGDTAVLTYNLVSVAGEQTVRWNCTEVYRKNGGRWSIVQTHWSFVRPGG